MLNAHSTVCPAAKLSDLFMGKTEVCGKGLRLIWLNIEMDFGINKKLPSLSLGGMCNFINTLGLHTFRTPAFEFWSNCPLVSPSS